MFGLVCYIVKDKYCWLSLLHLKVTNIYTCDFNLYIKKII